MTLVVEGEHSSRDIIVEVIGHFLREPNRSRKTQDSGWQTETPDNHYVITIRFRVAKTLLPFRSPMFN